MTANLELFPESSNDSLENPALAANEIASSTIINPSMEEKEEEPLKIFGNSESIDVHDRKFQIKDYFERVLNLSLSGEEFPVELDEVWSLAYSRKDDAVRRLTGEYFVQGVDYQVFHRNAENPKGGRPRDVYMISVSCMEFLIARKIREVFNVYREVFHGVARINRPIISKDEMELRKIEAQASLESAKLKQAELLLGIGNRTPVESMKQVVETLAVNVIAGFQAAELPAAKKSYSATEIGDMVGVSSNKIGRLANLNNLKTEEYGEWFHDKSQYSTKEVVSFRYFENAIPVFRELVEKEKKK